MGLTEKGLISADGAIQAPMTSTPDSFRLCSRCEDFDLSPILASDGHADCWPHGYLPSSFWRFELGPLNSLFIRAHTCSFCKFVCEMLDEQIGKNALIKKRYSRRHYSCDLVWDRQVRTGRSGQQCSIYHLDIAIVYFDSDDNDRRIIDTKLHRLLQPSLWPIPQLNSSGGDSQFWNKFQSGRLRPSICEPDLLRTWLNKCKSRHTGCWWTGPKALLRLRFFDVKFCCIRDFQVSQDDSVRYVALGYVWGSQAQRLTLAKANRDALGTKQTIERGYLSRTISDAATMVEILGERYLWVDALCIVQDDPHDLATQIPIMGQIYARSILTIVAAASDNAGSGLTGVGKQARSYQKHSGPLKGGTLLKRCSPKPKEDPTDVYSGEQHYLASSRWNNRGWTFQEKMLSRRCLFFTEEQVYWECQCASWCEDICLEVGPDIRWTVSEQPMFFSNEVFPAGQRMLGKDSIRPFSDLVQEYTSRSLTFENDSYRAFAGLIRVLEQRTGARFWHGIPVPDFNRCLFWRNDVVGSTLKSGRHFPSWSWLAWTGSTVMMLRASSDHTERIKCHGLSTDNSDRRRLVPVSDDLQLSCEYDTIKAYEIATYLWPKLRDGFHIFFWTMSAVLTISDGGCGICNIFSGRNPPERKYTRFGHVFGSEGSTDGAQEFVLIGSEANEMDYHGRALLLMISWQDGIASRVGAAYCDPLQWEDAMPQRKLIIMG